MGLLQKAAETFDHMQHLVGVEVEGKTALAPVGFVVTNAQIAVTLNLDGRFLSAEELNQKIIIPVTEESAGRTRGITAHPLCDRIGFISGMDAEKYRFYTEQLRDWCDSPFGNRKIRAILRYVETKTLLSDLESAGLLKRDEKGTFEKSAKSMVCWRVAGTDECEEVWRDREIIDAYSAYCESRVAKTSEKGFCYISGRQTALGRSHPKGVVAQYGNAKIISAKDTSNFTFRGRFVKGSEALTVGFEASQKAHNALRWLVGNDSIHIGDRVMICWNPEGKTVPKPQNPLCFSDETRLALPSAYKKQLALVIAGYKTKLALDDRIVTAVFGAATSGRLSVTYYSELMAYDYLDRLKYWDETCCWDSAKHGVYAPALSKIVDAAFGIQRESKGSAFLETDPKVKSQHIQRLLACRIDKAMFPTDIMKAAVQKCGNLQVLTNAIRAEQLFTTCAIIKKYRDDYFKEEWGMALEPERKDRSYQYGRLLAVMEKIEKDTYEADEKRETNAIRMQAVFVKRPAYATKIVMEQLKTAYYPQLAPGMQRWYDKLVGQIMEMLSGCGESDFNKPLSETYLLGYYLQRNAFYTKQNENKNTEE